MSEPYEVEDTATEMRKLLQEVCEMRKRLWSFTAEMEQVCIRAEAVLARLEEAEQEAAGSGRP